MVLSRSVYEVQHWIKYSRIRGFLRLYFRIFDANLIRENTVQRFWHILRSAIVLLSRNISKVGTYMIIKILLVLVIKIIWVVSKKAVKELTYTSRYTSAIDTITTTGTVRITAKYSWSTTLAGTSGKCR